jgi:hypothetical protein
MAGVTAQGLQVGAEAGGLGASALRLGGQRDDLPGVLGGGLGERRGVRLRGAARHRRVGPRNIALGPKVPGSAGREQQRPSHGDGQGVAREQPEDRGAHQG